MSANSAIQRSKAFESYTTVLDPQAEGEPLMWCVEAGDRVEQVRQTSAAAIKDGVHEAAGLVRPLVCQRFPQFNCLGRLPER